MIAAAALSVLLAAQETTFKVDVRLVRMLVTVKDAGGQLAGYLEKGDFAIFDNEIQQEIAVFEHHTEQPLSVSVMVDTSASTGRELSYEVNSVGRFLRAIFREGNTKDAVALYSFTHGVHLRSSFTRNLARLEGELKQLRPEAGTSLYDATWFAAKDLEDREGRHVIVLVTDGGDTTSTIKFGEALERAHQADAVIYSVLVVPINSDAGRNVGGENALTTFSRSTGGRVFTPSTGEQLDETFRQILQDLRTQYLLGFYPRNIPLTSERFHRVRLETPARPELRASARSGYYGEYDASAPHNNPRGKSPRKP